MKMNVHVHMHKKNMQTDVTSVKRGGGGTGGGVYTQTESQTRTNIMKAPPFNEWAPSVWSSKKPASEVIDCNKSIWSFQDALAKTHDMILPKHTPTLPTWSPSNFFFFFYFRTKKPQSPTVDFLLTDYLAAKRSSDNQTGPHLVSGLCSIFFALLLNKNIKQP